MATVLIVDDEADLRFVLRFALEDAGHAVVEASNGRAALEQIADAPPDVIVTDLMMPVMTGSELIAHLRADPATAAIPIVVWTAQPRSETGSDVTVTKTDGGPGVVRAVGQLLEGGRA